MAYMRFLERLSKILSWVGMGVLLVMMAVITLNVLTRAIFNTPIYGTVELASLTGVIMVSLIFAYTQLLRQNVIVSIVVDRMTRRLRQIFDLFTLLISMAFVGLVVWTSGAFALRFRHEITEVFEISSFPFRTIFALGCLVLFVVLVGQFAESLVKLVKKWTP